MISAASVIVGVVLGFLLGFFFGFWIEGGFD